MLITSVRRNVVRRGLVYRGLAGVVVAVALLSSACASSSKPHTSTSDGTSAVGSTARGGTGLIIELNGPLSLNGFPQVKKGSDDAAKALGVTYKYSAPANLDNFVPDYTALFNAAMAQHPAALVFGNYVASAFDPLIKRAIAAGVPVVVSFSGVQTWKQDGAISFVGVDEEALGGVAGGAALKAGVHDLLCIDQATNPSLEAECQAAKKAVEAAGANYAQLNVPLNHIGNPAQLTQDIQGYLHSHPNVDGIFTAGGGFGTDAAKAVENLGKKGQIKVGGNEVTSSTLQAIKDGSLTFEIGQQPYLIGYDAIQVAAQYLQLRQYPITPIITGGAVIDSSNVAEYLAIDQQHPGVLG
jgi:simple sugar transport system substrate-binding protein